MRDKIKKILREKYGKFETTLEEQYEDLVVGKLLDKNENVKWEWATYNQLVLEIKKELKDLMLTKELQYKLTDIENDPKKVCMEILSRIVNKNSELIRLEGKINGFYGD